MPTISITRCPSVVGAAHHRAGGRIHRRNARHRARRQRRVHPRQRPRPDRRLSDYRSRHDLDHAQRRPLGAGPCARLRSGDRLRAGAGARQARRAGARNRRIGRRPRSASASWSAAAGGRQRSVAARIVAKQEFAGYWEYVLDEAIFTAPAHPNWGGTALIGPAGDLIGIGSLQLQQAAEKGKPQNINMMVPIDLLKPIVDDLLKFGRRNMPPRPWLGLYATEVENRLVIVGLADRGPAKKADIRTGDIVLVGRRQGRQRSRRLLPPHLGARPSRRRRADHDLSRRRDHGHARQIERAQPVPQRAELALMSPHCASLYCFALTVAIRFTLLEQRPQPFAIGRIAQRDAELALELVVAHAPAFLPEAQRHRRHRRRGVREGDFRRRLASQQLRGKDDRIAGRRRLVVGDVENSRRARA